MVKVVGKNETLLHRCSCVMCSSILEFTKSEIRRSLREVDDHLETSKYIDCPNCGHVIDVSDNVR